LALRPLRASLTTLVSIKYIWRGSRVLDPLEILVAPDVGHGKQQFGERPLAWPGERRGEKRAVFGLNAAAVRARARFQRSNDFIVDSAHQQIRHSLAPNSMIAKISRCWALCKVLSH